MRPPKVESRLAPGHWEETLIKGASNRYPTGTLVKRATGFVALARMTSAGAQHALEGLGAALETAPPSLRRAYP